MLDKRLPYFNMLMRADWQAVRQIAPGPLPAGYRYRTYVPGDMEHWARIETSVGEFDDEADARACFASHYLPHADMLPGRLWFVLDADGVPQATANAWYDAWDGRRWASLHWVAVCPGHQGRGLGYAVTGAALAAFPEREPMRDVYLHTQTWSYRAVGIYLRHGFSLLREETFAHHRNDYDEAVRALPGYMRSELYDLMIRTAR
ncbi:GNAT family N-acetyltransferase [Eubacteriales bacterium OttesenSCG-928-A19]|nr:GNAT family N-acetyltransferase [Eubacteriales bacterium OttesenSCG-928-A19]